MVDMRIVAAYKEGMTLAQALEQRMSELQLTTATQVANDVGVAQSTVSRWMSGSLPRDDQLAAVATFLDISTDELGPILFATRKARNQVVEVAPLEHVHLSSSHGVDFDELREADPEAYDNLMQQARLLLERARERKEAR